MLNVIHFYIPWNVSLVPATSNGQKYKNTTSREEHKWFIMWQCGSDTVIFKWKLNIQIYSSPQFLFEKGRILSSCPSRFRFWTSPHCLMVVLLPSWGKNKCRALWIFIKCTWSADYHTKNISGWMRLSSKIQIVLSSGSVFVTNITKRQVNWFWWNFQCMLYMTQAITNYFLIALHRVCLNCVRLWI